MASHHHINVYAQLPLVVDFVNLDLSTANWPWVHCLTLPLETLNALRLSRRPYRWILFAIGVVIGARGEISSGPGCNLDLDFVGALTETADLYYHISDEEKRRMFPVDPEIGRTHDTSSMYVAQGIPFHDRVAERDTRQCVVASIMEWACKAVHLLPHSKGDEYIWTFTRHRSRDPTENDIIDNIDDVRNGLFLNVFTHRSLGKRAGFLVTPNFAMDTTDIDPTASPVEERCTAQTFLFPPDKYALGDTRLQSGSPLRLSHTPDWPPAVLFDAVYAGAVLHNFGTQELKDALTKNWRDTFYPGGIKTAADAAHEVSICDKAAAMQRGLNEAQECQEHNEAHHVPDMFDMLLTLPYVLVPPAMLRASKEKAEAAEQRRVRDEVNAWTSQVTGSMPVPSPRLPPHFLPQSEMPNCQTLLL